MLIQILPGQIKDHWEVIKFASINSDGIAEKYQEVYALNLLQDLLSSKKFCYVISREDKIVFVAILEFQVNTMTEVKSLFFRNVYAFESNILDIWQEVLKDLCKIAGENECNEIIGESNNSRMIEILRQLNVPCVNQRFVYSLKEG